MIRPRATPYAARHQGVSGRKAEDRRSEACRHAQRDGRLAQRSTRKGRSRRRVNAEVPCRGRRSARTGRLSRRGYRRETPHSQVLPLKICRCTRRCGPKFCCTRRCAKPNAESHCTSQVQRHIALRRCRGILHFAGAWACRTPQVREHKALRRCNVCWPSPPSPDRRMRPLEVSTLAHDRVPVYTRRAPVSDAASTRSICDFERVTQIENRTSLIQQIHRLDCR